MSIFLKQFKFWLYRGLVLILLLLVLIGEGPPPQDREFRISVLSGQYTFDFLAWEVEALARKIAFGLLAPQRFMNEEARARFVLDYLEGVDAARRLAGEIDQTYIDPDVEDPASATVTEREELQHLRSALKAQAPIAEAILGEQVSQVLDAGGFGPLRQMVPPVSGTFTPLPQILIISPRDRIESIYQKELVPGMDTAEQSTLETLIETEQEDLSTYITKIGGLAAYPAMLLESTSIHWIADVMAHEWTHHHLMQRPLGWNYFGAPETRTINETTASLVGEWAGQEVIRRFYVPYLETTKGLPNPLTREEEETTLPAFDFRAEMHETRVNVDELLEKGYVEEAEAYMEARRRLFVDHGYQIRRLNQAYFAFHGAYASYPGASGADPIGPAVRQLWALSKSPRDFVHRVGGATTLEEVHRQIREAAQTRIEAPTYN